MQPHPALAPRNPAAAPLVIGHSQRNVQLDALRGAAILMVLVCHTFVFRKAGWEAMLVRGGWAGVDLFFVLSGFLISGLLFSEYQRTGRIRFRRFALRRAFKLYPAFYVLVALTVTVRLFGHHHVTRDVLAALFHDIFFLQSYLQGTYPHFWSLAVEEHFYILLPLLLYFMLKRPHSGDPDPFRRLPAVFFIVAFLALMMRLWTERHIDPMDVNAHFQPSHLRMDSLLFGVLLSYWANFHGQRFWGFVRARYGWLLGAAVILIAPTLFIEEQHPWMHTYGFLTNYLGFGALLLGALSLPVERLPRAPRALFQALAYIGTFSYSIYLWHFAWIYGLIRLHIAVVPYIGVLVYFAGAIAVGILTAKLVEMPALRLRERLVPSSPARVVEAPDGAPAVAQASACSVGTRGDG